MKSTFSDYLWSGLLITVLSAISLSAAFLLSKFTPQLLGAYHVLLDAAVFLLSFGLLAGVSIRLYLGMHPIAPGSYTTQSKEFSQWKLLTVLYHLGRGSLRPLFPFFLLPLVDAILGAKVGKDVAFGGMIDDPYWVEVGNEVVLGHNSLVSGSYLWDGKLVCGRVKIGDGATVGANAIVFPDVQIGDGANIMNGACVMPGSRVLQRETWRGNPARRWSQGAVPRVADE